MRLYYHKTDGGAEYLYDTFIECPNGHQEGTITDQTQYVVRIDGDIEKDAELNGPGLALKDRVEKLEAAVQNLLHWHDHEPDGIGERLQKDEAISHARALLEDK